MAITSKYVISDSPGANFIDFGFHYGNLSMQGRELEYSGSATVDAVFVHPGMTFDFTASKGGQDKLYLEGNWADYAIALESASGVMTLTRGTGTQAETIRFVKSPTLAASDLLVFADGTVNSHDIYTYKKTGGAAPTPSGETSTNPQAPALPGTPLDATVAAYAFDATGETFALTRPGIKYTTTGSAGVDTVYVSRGATVDATALRGDRDDIYFTGKWGDYTKTVGSGSLLFTRVVDGHTETVKVAAGLGANNDRLIFADGAINSNDAKNNPDAPIDQIPGYDPNTVVPLPTAPVIAMVAGDDIINAAEATSTVITGTSSANARIALTLGTGNVHTDILADASGHWSYVLQQADIDAMGQGAETISAVATDTAGNRSLAATRLITIDTSVLAQTATITSYTDNVGIIQGDLPSGTRTDDTTPVLKGTLSAPLNTGDSVQIYEGTALLGQATMTDSSHWNFAVGNLVNGSTHTYTARVVDLAGNKGATSNPFSLTVDTTGPTTTNSTSLINGTHTMSLGDFKFIEAEDNLSAVRINSTAGGDGELRLNGVRVTSGQTVDAADIIAGKLVWVETTPVTTATKTFNINYDVYDTIGLISPASATLTITRAAAAGTRSGNDSWFNQTSGAANDWQHVIDAVNSGGHIAVVNNSSEWTAATTAATDGYFVEVGLRQNPDALGHGFGYQWYDGTRINTSVTPWGGQADGGGGANNGGGENKGVIYNTGLNDLGSNAGTYASYGARYLTEYETKEFTHIGFTGADTLDFTAVANRSILVNGRGGADTIFGGGGNDTILVPDTGFTGINGNGGFDILEFTAAGAVRGATLAAKITNMEEIKLGAGNQQLTLTQTEVNALTSSSNHTLYVSGTSGDQLGIDVGAGANSWHLMSTAGGLNTFVWHDAGNAATTTRLLVDTDVQVAGHDSKLLTTTTINNFTDNVGGVQGELGPMVRYLRIYHTDATPVVALTGLKVYAGGVDVAADLRSSIGADSGFADTQSRSYEALTDENVGGGHNGISGTNSNLAHTATYGTKPYIDLDLGALYAVDSLTLWGRADIPAQSNNLRVYAGAEAFGTATYNDLATNAEVKYYDLATVDTTYNGAGTSITGMADTVTDDSTPTVNGTLSQAIGATDVVKVYDNGVSIGDATVNGATWSYTPATPLTALSSHSYTARVVDAAGKSGSVSNALELTVLARGELLVNGPIEGSGTGWGINRAGSTLKYEEGHFNYDGGGGGYGGSVYQTFNVVAGQQYTVHYQIQYSGGGYNSTEFMLATVQDGSVWNAGTQLGSNYGNISGGYQDLSFTFTATSSTATVVFTNDYGQVTAGCDLYLNKASVMLSTDAAYTTTTNSTSLINGTHTMSLGDFKFAETDGSLSAVRINSTTNNDGELRLNGVRVTNGQTVTAADIIAGNLVWVETTPVTTATKTFDINYHVYDSLGLISPTGATLSLTRAAAAGTLSGSGSWFQQTDTSANSWQHVIDAVNRGGHLAVVNDSDEWTTAKAVASDGVDVEIGLRQNPNALGNAYGWQWYDGTRINTGVTQWNTGEPNGGGGANNGGWENQGTINNNVGLNDLAVNSASRALTEYEQNEFTHNGFTGADTLDFTGVANRSVLVNGRGGADTIFGGSGNDTISVPNTSFTGINGNAGFDILEFTAAGAVKGATLAAKSSNIEGIKLGAGNQQLTLTHTDVNAITSSSNNHTLYLNGTSGDQLGIDVGTTASSWHLTGTAGGLNNYTWHDSSNTATTTRLLVDTDVQVVGHDSTLLTTTTINDFSDNVGAAQGELGPMVRYLRIYHTDATPVVALTGLKVYAGGVDVAADIRSSIGAESGFSDTQSRSYEALTDENVGGGFNGQAGTNSNLAHTATYGTKPYIDLDLGALYAVDSLTLWGRADIPAQSNNLRVYAGANPFGPNTYSNLATNAEVKHYDLATVDTTYNGAGTSITGMADTSTDDTTPALNGTLSQAIGATDLVKVYDNGVYLGDATVNGTTWTYTPATPLTDGSTHRYTAKVADAAGNTGTASAAINLTVSTPAERLTDAAITTNPGGAWVTHNGASNVQLSNGSYVFNWGNDTTGSSVSQTITNLVAGEIYTLQSQLQVWGNPGFQYVEIRIRDGANWNGGTQLTYHNIGLNTGPAVNYADTFTATSSTATIVYTNTQATAVTDLLLNKASLMLADEAARTTFTPLVLDLNGNGVQTTDVDHGVLFDVGNTGMLGRTAWADAADGLLVRDVNGNGVIDHGGELFGQGTLLADCDQAANGFAALAQFDANQDGTIDVRDAVFQELRVWRDGNSDGVSQADELHSLTDLGITSLDLAATPGSTVENGNHHGLVSSYTTADGQDHDLVDVWFQQGAQVSLTNNEAGVTRLQLVTNDQSLDLTTLDTTRLQGADRIDLTGAGSNTLTLSLQEVLALGDQDSCTADQGWTGLADSQGRHQLVVDGDVADQVVISGGGFVSAATAECNGVLYSVYNSLADSAQLLVNQQVVMA